MHSSSSHLEEGWAFGGVVEVGGQLSHQLQSLESEFLQNAPHLSQDSRAGIQELSGIRNAFLELRQASLKNNNLKKLAHDIRSPLTALSIAIRSLGNEQGPAKELLEQSYERMESISRDILAPPKSAGSTTTSIPIETLIHKLIKEKRAEAEEKGYATRILSTAMCVLRRLHKFLIAPNMSSQA